MWSRQWIESVYEISMRSFGYLLLPCIRYFALGLADAHSLALRFIKVQSSLAVIHGRINYKTVRAKLAALSSPLQLARLASS